MMKSLKVLEALITVKTYYKIEGRQGREKDMKINTEISNILFLAVAKYVIRGSPVLETFTVSVGNYTPFTACWIIVYFIFSAEMESHLMYVQVLTQRRSLATEMEGQTALPTRPLQCDFPGFM